MKQPRLSMKATRRPHQALWRGNQVHLLAAVLLNGPQPPLDLGVLAVGPKPEASAIQLHLPARVAHYSTRAGKSLARTVCAVGQSSPGWHLGFRAVRG